MWPDKTVNPFPHDWQGPVRIEPPSVSGERWTINVCADCGRVEGQGVFEYECADESWCCEACDNYPSRARSVEVMPIQPLADYIDKLREEADALTKKTMGYPIPATVHAARRIAGDLSNLIPKEGD